MIISLFSITGTGCSGIEPTRPFVSAEGKLPACPSSPNCVSTQAEDPDKRMEPLPFKGDLEQSRQQILAIVNSLKRSKVTDNQKNSTHVEFRSAVFRFVDDVDFFFDESAGMIHFRSAARSGYLDFGVNRKRMQLISDRYLN
ncbi:DUF1499 domain-containing protein [bacterium]|nr:DUF1499 domain-containing protein [bacterium]